tara:strand:+ start:996 stop:1610 length:615 start_codon:yes stop_codon:yes gene_type:complete
MLVFNLKGILLIASLIIAIPTSAADCFSDSPSKKNGTLGEIEAHISKLSASQTKDINNLFNSFRGKWNGIAEYLSCQGNKASPKKGYASFNLKGKVEAKKNNLRINAELKALESNRTKPINLRISIADQFLRHNSESKKGDIEIISIKKNLIHYLKKYRGTAGSAETIEEQVVILRKVKSEYVLEQRHYKAGEMFGKEVWVFRK